MKAGEVNTQDDYFGSAFRFSSTNVLDVEASLASVTLRSQQ